MTDQYVEVSTGPGVCLQGGEEEGSLPGTGVRPGATLLVWGRQTQRPCKGHDFVPITGRPGNPATRATERFYLWPTQARGPRSQFSSSGSALKFFSSPANSLQSPSSLGSLGAPSC